jgi:hypothetical protein
MKDRCKVTIVNNPRLVLTFTSTLGSETFKYKKTYQRAVPAAKEYASYLAGKINHERYKAKKPRDGYDVDFNPKTGKFEVTSQSWTVYDKAYRRVLKIFKQVLP